MRLLYIVSTDSWSGSSIALYNLIKQIYTRHEIHVLFPKRNEAFCEKLDKLGIPYSFSRSYLNVYPKTFSPDLWMKIFWKTISCNKKAKRDLEALIKEFRPDIVHNNVGPLDISFDICRRAGIPHVWHLREYQDLDFNMTFIPTKNYFQRKILQRGNYNIAITQGVFNHWHLRKETDAVIYDGVFDGANLPEAQNEKKNYFLFAGRVEKGKGVLDAIKAFHLFCKERNDHRLLIAGKYWETSPFFKKCQKYINQNGLTDKVDFLGERTDVYTLMAQAKALLVPSLFEGFGFITVEAMLNHCIVIGRNTGGTKEQFDNGLAQTGHEIGLRFHTVEEMASHMQTAIIENLQEMRKYAYETVIKNYSQQIHARKIEAFYSQICRK